MNKLNKTDSLLKWIILGLSLACILSLFLPVYQLSSRYSTSVEKYYWYQIAQHNYSFIYLGGMVTVVLLNMVALSFLFGGFKNSRLFFFGFSGAFSLNSIFSILQIKSIINNETGSSSTIEFSYGYYIFVVLTALLIIAMICYFVCYLILKSTDKKAAAKTDVKDVADELKQRVALLNDMKSNGILTEEEYELKRSELIQNLRI